MCIWEKTTWTLINFLHGHKKNQISIPIRNSGYTSKKLDVWKCKVFLMSED